MDDYILIEDYVAVLMGIDVSEISSKRRFRKASDARKICWKLCREYAKVSNQEIGEYYNHDRSTVYCGIKACDNLSLHDKEFQDKYDKVKKAYLDHEIILPFSDKKEGDKITAAEIDFLNRLRPGEYKLFKKIVKKYLEALKGYNIPNN